VDAIKADWCGGAVATMGKAVSATQLDVIRRAGIKKIYLALDPDAAEEVNRLAYELGDMETRLLLPPKGRKDLGECSFEEVYEAFQQAEPFTAGNLLLSLRA
jgi:DNA primase